MADVRACILLFLIWLIPTILIRRLFRNGTSYRLPPSPLALPIIGHLHHLLPIPHQALHKLSTRYGPLIHLYLGSVPCVVVSSPEFAKKLLKTHEISFSNRPQTAIVDYMTYGTKGFAFAPYGPYWKFMKKLCMSELLGGRTLDLLLPVRRDEILRFLELLSKKAKDGEAVDMDAELIKLTSNVVSRMAMSVRCSDNEDESEGTRRLVAEIAELVGQFNISDFIWFCRNFDFQGLRKRIKDVCKRYDAMIEKIIEEHQQTRRKNKKNNGQLGQEVKDLLDVLLDISEDENADIRLTRENIKSFILDIFVAGTDTTALTIEWALSELINHPDILQKAAKEIDSIIGSDRLVNESDVAKLPYLQAIVKETLRLHPPSPIVLRESSEDCEIGGYHIPARTRIFVNLWSIGKDPNYWENPLEFRPERFLCGEGKETNSVLDVRGQHFHLLPFGSGRRGCPGISLALQIVQTSLAAMVQCFEWKINGEGSGKVNMEEGTGLTLPRAHPLVCYPVIRRHPLPLSV